VHLPLLILADCPQFWGNEANAPLGGCYQGIRAAAAAFGRRCVQTFPCVLLLAEPSSCEITGVEAPAKRAQKQIAG
jgi:hypothetical protein